MKALLLRHRHLTAVILLVIVLACVWFFRSETGHGWRVDLWNHASDVHDLLSSAPPWIYFTVTGILPLLGVPMVSFYLLTASMYSPHVAILGTAYAITLNLLLSYLVGRLGHRAITALIARTGRAIPQIPPKHRIWMTAAVRVTPGAPLLVQNYLLVLAGVPLTTFILVSLPLELLIAAGYVLLGRSLFTGNWKLLLLAAAIVAVAIVVFRTLRKRSEARSRALGIADPATGAADSAEGATSTKIADSAEGATSAEGAGSAEKPSKRDKAAESQGATSAKIAGSIEGATSAEGADSAKIADSAAEAVSSGKAEAQVPASSEADSPVWAKSDDDVNRARKQGG